MFFSMRLYFDKSKEATLNIIFIWCLIISYFFPLLFHTKSLEFVQFTRGVFCLIFMTPTFINIFMIYAASNIHDVSWGSRPTVKDETYANFNLQDNMSIEYRNYRSNYLIIWLIINIGAGLSVVSISRSDGKYSYLLLYILVILTVIVALKVCLCHILHTKYYPAKATYILNNRYLEGKVFDINNSNDETINKFQETRCIPVGKIKLDIYLNLTKGKLIWEV